MAELTKDADKVLCIIYKQYLSNIKNGNSKVSSNSFEENFHESDKILSRWHPDDVSNSVLELGRKKYLKIYIGGNFLLTDQAIIYMENRFKNGLHEVIELVSKFV